MKYKNASSPEEYLKFVLSDWKRFGKENGGLCKAIKDLLEKVARLEKEIKENEKNN